MRENPRPSRVMPPILKEPFLMKRPLFMGFKEYKRKRSAQNAALKWYLTGKRFKKDQLPLSQIPFLFY